MLGKNEGPKAAATTQLQLELMDANTDPVGLQDITRIWSSFHFFPGDLYAEKKRCSKRYLRKNRLICDVNGDLLADTVKLAKGSSLTAAGIAMHVLADIWAHRYFAGTPSLVINNTEFHFEELIKDGDCFAVIALVSGVILGSMNTVVYIYSAGVIYSGIMKIAGSFRRTAIVYIQ